MKNKMLPPPSRPKPWLCRLGVHSRTIVAYGYPLYSKTWLTIKRCGHCGHILFEWDDLFAEARPAKFPLHLDAMTYAGELSGDLKALCAARAFRAAGVGAGKGPASC